MMRNAINHGLRRQALDKFYLVLALVHFISVKPIAQVILREVEDTEYHFVYTVFNAQQ